MDHTAKFGGPDVQGDVQMFDQRKNSNTSKTNGKESKTNSKGDLHKFKSKNRESSKPGSKESSIKNETKKFGNVSDYNQTPGSQSMLEDHSKKKLIKSIKPTKSKPTTAGKKLFTKSMASSQTKPEGESNDSSKYICEGESEDSSKDFNSRPPTNCKFLQDHHNSFTANKKPISNTFNSKKSSVAMVGMINTDLDNIDEEGKSEQQLSQENTHPEAEGEDNKLEQDREGENDQEENPEVLFLFIYIV